MDGAALFLAAAAFGAVVADWAHRREMIYAVKQTADDLNKILATIGDVHNKLTAELAAMGERLGQAEIRMATIGIAKPPFGRQ